MARQLGLRSDERRGRLFKFHRLPFVASADPLCHGSRRAAARQSTGLIEDDSRGRQPFLSLLSPAFLDALANRAGDYNGTWRGEKKCEDSNFEVSRG